MSTKSQEAMSKSEILEKLLLNHLDVFESNGGGGVDCNLPDFELYAIDYLDFAEKRLNNIDKYKDDVDELINCIAHLKRAVDCQLDTFFYSVGLYKTIRERNLKFERKLDFLSGIGVFSSRSLARLNTLRNKMEHHYEVPKIDDIELYFDLVSAFVSVVQGLIFSLGFYRDIEFTINIDEDDQGSFESNYDDEKLEISMTWNLKKSDEKKTMIAKFDDLDEFIYFFKVHILLVQLDTFANWRHIYDRIKLNNNKKK